ALAAKALGAELMAVAKERHLAAHLEERLAVGENVERRTCRTGHYVLADAHEHRSFERFDAILAEARQMKLHNRPWPAVRSRKRFVAAGSDVAVEPGLAIAQDGR